MVLSQHGHEADNSLLPTLRFASLGRCPPRTTDSLCDCFYITSILTKCQ
jgi:hypothetical protein